MSDSPLVARLLELTAANNITTGQDLLELSQAKPIYEVELSDSDYVDGMLEFGKLGTLDLDTVELGKLDWSPRKNWVEVNGGLPRYIEQVALGIIRGTGKPREQAIPIAINRIKRWAAGLDGVKSDTIAKSIAALAQWQALKAKAKAKRIAKKG